jgi:hypothetical protein
MDRQVRVNEAADERGRNSAMDTMSSVGSSLKSECSKLSGCDGDLIKLSGCDGDLIRKGERALKSVTSPSRGCILIALAVICKRRVR